MMNDESTGASRFNSTKVRKGRGRASKSSHGLTEDSIVSVLQVLVAKVDEKSKELFNLAPKLIQLTNRVESVQRENISLKKILTKKNVKIENLDQRLEVVEIQAISKFVVLLGQFILSDGPDLRFSEQISQVLHVSREKQNAFHIKDFGKTKTRFLLEFRIRKIELRAARTIHPRNLFCK